MFQCSHRYSDFEALHASAVEALGAVRAPKLPGKGLLKFNQKKDRAFLAERRLKLDAFLNRLATASSAFLVTAAADSLLQRPKNVKAAKQSALERIR